MDRNTEIREEMTYNPIHFAMSRKRTSSVYFILLDIQVLLYTMAASSVVIMNSGRTLFWLFSTL